jgi:hypothetical protein
MKKLYTLVLTVIAAISFPAMPVMAQKTKPFSHLSIGLRASTLGGGVELATSMTKGLTFRAGFNMIPLGVRTDNIVLSNVNEEIMDAAFGYMPEIGVKPKLEMYHGNILADYNFGIFHLTAGVYIGSTKIVAHGQLVDSDNKPAQLLNGLEWPSIIIDGKEVGVKDGKVNANAKLGNTVKPYFGIGLGRSVPKHRVGFKFELGVMYQGDYALDVNNISIDLEQFFGDKISMYTKWLKWWPMLNFQLNVKIF